MEVWKLLVVLTATINMIACEVHDTDAQRGHTDAIDTPLIDDPLAFNTEVVGFECIEELADRIELLGRGTDYPNFLIMDIKRELVRQDPRTKLTKAECKGSVELKVSLVDIEDSDAQALDYLKASFPIDIWVDFTAEKWMMEVSFSYEINGLSSQSKPTLKKEFKVLKTYNEEGKLLNDPIQIIRKS